MAYDPSLLPFFHTDPAKPFAPQVKQAVVIKEVKIKRRPKDSRPPLVFSALYFVKGVKIAKTTNHVEINA